MTASKLLFKFITGVLCCRIPLLGLHHNGSLTWIWQFVFKRKVLTLPAQTFTLLPPTSPTRQYGLWGICKKQHTTSQTPLSNVIGQNIGIVNTCSPCVSQVGPVHCSFSQACGSADRPTYAHEDRSCAWFLAPAFYKSRSSLCAPDASQTPSYNTRPMSKSVGSSLKATSVARAHV